MPQALKCPDVDALSVLDNRAATHTKLLRYDQALRDARYMIKRNKQDERVCGPSNFWRMLIIRGTCAVPKHYCWMEKLKRLLKSTHTRSSLCQKTIRDVRYGSRPQSEYRSNCQVLEQMHAKLQEKLVSKCYDPFSVFPLEIASMVLSHFDFRQIVYVLLLDYLSNQPRAILRVSKGWDRFLSSKRDLWMRLDFSTARSRIHWSSALACIKRSKAMLTQAVMANLTKASVHRVLEYVSRCPNLQHLELLTPSTSDSIHDLFKGCKSLRTLLVSADTVVSQSTITKLLSALPNLERIEVRSTTKSRSSEAVWPQSLPNLKSITFGTLQASSPVADYVPPLYIPRQIDSSPLPLPNLAELRLHSNPQVFVPYPPSFNPAGLPNLKKLDISGLYVGGDFGLPTSLEFLRICGGAAVEAIPFDIRDGEGNERPLSLPRLNTLIFSDVPWVTHITLSAFIETAQAPLEVLHVDSCFRLTAASIYPLIGNAKTLHTLNVAHIMSVWDVTVGALVTSLPTLKVLNLSYTDITGVAIKELADRRVDGSSAKIDYVYVKGCERVSPDAIEYGRSRGLVIAER